MRNLMSPDTWIWIIHQKMYIFLTKLGKAMSNWPGRHSHQMQARIWPLRIRMKLTSDFSLKNRFPWLTKDIADSKLCGFRSKPSAYRKDMAQHPAIDINSKLDLVPAIQGWIFLLEKAKGVEGVIECTYWHYLSATREVILGSNVEWDDGLIKCSKAGCEMQWVSSSYLSMKNIWYLPFTA